MVNYKLVKKAREKAESLGYYIASRSEDFDVIGISHDVVAGIVLGPINVKRRNRILAISDQYGITPFTFANGELKELR